MLFWTMVVARGQKVVYEVTISVVVVAKGVAVVLWVRVQGQLVIVRVVAWVDDVSGKILQYKEVYCSPRLRCTSHCPGRQ